MSKFSDIALKKVQVKEQNDFGNTQQYRSSLKKQISHVRGNLTMGNQNKDRNSMKQGLSVMFKELQEETPSNNQSFESAAKKQIKIRS